MVMINKKHVVRRSEKLPSVEFKAVPRPEEPTQKRQRFLDNIEARMERALERIRLVKQCFNSNNYEWTAPEAEKVIGALEAATRRVKLAALRIKEENKDSFKL